MRLLSLPLLRQRSEHDDKIPHRRCTVLRDVPPFHVTTTQAVHSMIFIIIVIMSTCETTIKVAGFQRQTRYQQLQYIRTNLSSRKLQQPPPTSTTDSSTITSISIKTLHQRQSQPSLSRRSKTQLYFMGSDSGILGVGGPEVFLIVLVGYFVLGPSDLYKLVKQIGAFIQNIRTLGNDLSTTFENNMESTLQLEEIRKAQRELNDAFSFRRTINVDADSDAFSVQAGSAQKAEAERLAAVAAATSATVTTGSDTTSAQPRPKKIRRRIRKKEEDQVIPDLPSMSEYNMQSAASIQNNVPDLEMPTSDSDEEAAIIEEEFNQYVLNPMTSTFDDWDSWNGTDRSGREADLQNINGTGTAVTRNVTAAATIDPARKLTEQNRFQQQLSGSWNDQILQAGDSLEPIALVMNKIALLEQEKNAALQRLDDEYAQRTAIEEKYYKEQRQLLEETARNVQSNVFGLDSKKTVA